MREDIIGDTRYGMNTLRNLTIWVAATLKDPDAKALIQSHYFSGKERISMDFYDGLTSESSTIANSIAAINKKLVSAGIVPNDTMTITSEWLGAQQWAQADLLNNKDLTIHPSNFVSMTSAYELGMNFLLQPEIQSAGCDVDFTAELARQLFQQNLTLGGEVTLLSPVNYFAFQEDYETQ
jgi:hypothetical protein